MRDTAPAVHRTVEQRACVGREARLEVVRSSHASWEPDARRPDPVALLEEQNESRLPELVPIRHRRMCESSFAFYRGAALVMASDLSSTPATGLTVQLCGDAHLANFGVYASPERNLVFDISDFDETLRGPWEWDLKRLATSFTIAAQHNGFGRSEARRITATAVAAYRRGMRRFAGVGTLELWYSAITLGDVAANVAAGSSHDLEKRLYRLERRARAQDSRRALEKLALSTGDHYIIRSQPPLLYAIRDLPSPYDATTLEADAHDAFERYKSTLRDHQRWLVDRFTLVDVALKVVGVGSVGTRCFVLLLEGRDRNDPLFLQVKEATTSVLEGFLDPSPYGGDHGRRVVEGQRLVQAQSDIFLGWTTSRAGARYFLRQLRDWRGSANLAGATPARLELYAELCGLTLARGHARSGDAVAIAAYCGKGDVLDRAVTTFAEAYAAQNVRDYEAFAAAVEDRRLEVAPAA